MTNPVLFPYWKALAATWSAPVRSSAARAAHREQGSLLRRTPDESCVGRPGRPVEPRIHRGEPVPWTQPGPGLPPALRWPSAGPVVVGCQSDSRGRAPCAFVARLLPAPGRCQPSSGVLGRPRARWRQLQYAAGDGDPEGPDHLHLQCVVPVRRGRLRAPGADA
ncbi:hypothetical protein D3C71_1755230 [compost metagenome]